MPKRGRGLNKNLIKSRKVRERLQSAKLAMEKKLSPDAYQRAAETVRKDADFLLEHSTTIYDKMKYNKDVFTTCKFYFWRRWKVGTLQNADDYMAGKMLQAEDLMWDLRNQLRSQMTDREKTLQDTFERMGFAESPYAKRDPADTDLRIRPGLTIRTPSNKPPLDKIRLLKAKTKYKKFLMLNKRAEQRYKADKDNRAKFVEWQLAHKRWKRADQELKDAAKASKTRPKPPAAGRFKR